MIYFLCGAPKNGSHFHYFIITKSLEQRGIPFRRLTYVDFAKDDVKAGRSVLQSLDQPAGSVHVVKRHWGTAEQRDALLSLDHIRIFHIWRDVRDVLVSHYYYMMNRYQASYHDFADYYWQDGRSQLFMQQSYRRVWLSRTAAHPQVLHSSFKELKVNFQEAARAILDFAGIEGVDLGALEEQLSIDRLRKSQQDARGVMFRRGAVGEYEDVIQDPAIVEDIAWIERQRLPMLRLAAFKHHPRVVTHPYFTFPGKKLLLAGRRVYRMMHGKKGEEKEKVGGRWK